MAITVHVSDPKEDKLYVNLPDGDMESEVILALEKILESEEYTSALDASAVSEKVFDVMEEYGLIFEW